MMQAIILTPEEWILVSELIATVQELQQTTDDGGLAGAVNRESEPGKKLMLHLRDIVAATKALPADLDLITRDQV